MTNVLRLFADAPAALPALALSSLKLFYRRLADELASAVLARNGVDPVLDVGGYPHEHGDGFDFVFERRATHAAPCARFQ